MDVQLDICIWALDSDIIENIDKKIRLTLTKHTITARVRSNAEPPLVARMNLTAYVPVLEINNIFWHHSAGGSFSQDACDQLIAMAVKHYCPEAEETVT